MLTPEASSGPERLYARLRISIGILHSALQTAWGEVQSPADCRCHETEKPSAVPLSSVACHGSANRVR